AIRPEVVLSHGPWTHAVLGPGVPASTPLIFYAHNPSSRDWLHRLAAGRRPTHVLVNSEFTRRSVDALFPGVTTDVVTYVLAGSVGGRPNGGVRGVVAPTGE